MQRMDRMGAAPIGILLAIASPAVAQTQTAKQAFQVQATIANGCTVTSSGGSAWGQIQFPTVPGVTTKTVDADLLSSGQTGLQIDCTPGMTVTLTADTGQNPSSGNVRQMKISGDSTTPVPYLLYGNGGATPWTSQGIALSFPVGTSHLSFPIHARATLPTATKAGAYSDTVRVTMTW
jgi:spore coat protein U-like protein